MVRKTHKTGPFVQKSGRGEGVSFFLEMTGSGLFYKELRHS